MQQAFAPSVHGLELLREGSSWFSQCQAHFIKEPDFQLHVGYCLPPTRHYGHGKELRRFRSGEFKQSPLPPKAHLYFAYCVPERQILTSHSNTCVP